MNQELEFDPTKPQFIIHTSICSCGRENCSTGGYLLKAWLPPGILGDEEADLIMADMEIAVARKYITEDPAKIQKLQMVFEAALDLILAEIGAPTSEARKSAIVAPS